MIKRSLCAAILLFLSGDSIAALSQADYDASSSWITSAPPAAKSFQEFAPLASAILASKPVPLRYAHAGIMSTPVFLDAAMHWEWKHKTDKKTFPGGDWLDRDGAENGPNPTFVGSAATETFDISGVPGDLIIQGLPKTSKVMIDGVDITSQSYWYTPNSGFASPAPTTSSPNVVIVPNDAGKSMTVVGVPAKTPYRVDRVDEPYFKDLPYVGPRNMPTIFSIDPTSVQAITKTWPTMSYATSTNDDGSVGIAPQGYTFGNDGKVNYITLNPFVNGHPRLINWTYRMPDGTRDIYVGELAWFDDTIWPAMGELGIKLSGVEARVGTNLTGFFSIFELSEGGSKLATGGVKVNQRNAGLYGLHDYFRDAAVGVNTSGGHPPFLMATTGRWYWLEGHYKLNTPGQADGIDQKWVNGHLVLDRHDVVWSNDPSSANWTWHVQIQRYAGGLARWVLTPDLLARKEFFRLGQFAVSTQYIGVPMELGR